jgi:hypothetical protein
LTGRPLTTNIQALAWGYRSARQSGGRAAASSGKEIGDGSTLGG